MHALNGFFAPMKKHHDAGDRYHQTDGQHGLRGIGP
jgi:hypothetical protein